MKKFLFVIYAWGSTVLFGFLIFWLSTVPNLQAGNELSDDLIKVIFRMVLYAILFILLYRSIIITLKSTVVRLANYRSRNEKFEDSEFVLIIETMAVVICVVSCVAFAFFEEQNQLFTNGRNGTESFLVESNGEYFKSDNVSPIIDSTYISLNSITEANKDILIALLSSLLTGMVVYSMPVIGELEIALKHKLQREFRNKKDS